MTAPDYALISPATAWVNPIPPAPTFTIPPNTNGLTERNLRDQYKHQCNLFQTQHNVSQALKKLIDDAVPNEYLDEIRQPYLNLLPISIPDIFAHLYQQPSSNVTPEAVEERHLSVEKQKYSLDEELTTYFKRLQDYQTFAAQGGEEVTANNLMNIDCQDCRQ
ncbi:unnamed protein product [Cylindrotheca closterium]|uniref:Uncharacterized protein n=1 Tax=Cylindrotheca closterium TaxID=2856 RepID=A0AAD2G4K8_9STRA|nr:unnamed protein product [Cylindrotheca closterium]